MPRQESSRALARILGPIQKISVAVRVTKRVLKAFEPRRRARLQHEIEQLPAVVNEAGVVTAITLQTDAQDQTANRLLAESKAYRKTLKLHPAYVAVKGELDRATNELRQWVAAHEQGLPEAQAALSGAIARYRDAKAEQAAAQAREEAEREAERIEKEREAERKRLEKEHKRTRSPEARKAIAHEIEHIESAPVLNPQAVADRARAQSHTSMGGRGRGSVVKGYEILIDDLELLAAAVVGSNPHLLNAARKVRTSDLDPVSVDALNAKRVSGVLVPAPWLTRYARSRKGDVRIPGVIVRERSSVRST